MTTPKIGFVSLGCPKALVDSEYILTQLRTEGYEIVPQYNDADLVVVNTCGFIDSAVQESLDAIGEALDENGKVIVTGCLGAKADTILEKYPNVLSVTGPHAFQELMGAVHHHLPKPHDPFMDLVPQAGIKLTPRHYAYLKIAEGCNHSCTFCIIPTMRGKHQSYPVENVLSQAKKLVNSGVKELLVVAQDTSAYGVDVKYKTGFADGTPVRTHIQNLCEELGKMDAWVRLHYIYPYPHVDHLIPLMAEGKILPYIDVPMQHASPRILKAMKRPANSENMLMRIKKWREICPEITIRSTFIVGFPGETEEEFQMLLDFIEEARLDRVGAFIYSPVEGAPANDIAELIPVEIQEERLGRFMELQARISAEKLALKVGQTLEVLVDDFDADNGVAIGRTKADAPEIDGLVYIDGADASCVGKIVNVLIDEADTYDLYGELI
ncbi:30S ribosomal protein S12 methylthiotransferase RimO [Wohlfahrtiimonas chitiniclastica]|uniref:30S ribosomal protein S12 methylthiotransferase RimO n=1 Tax=Wohlfahrtiimonas chitiniclastica TaxID=400946 RepID=UPI000B99422D|nr:30S ribosomal protein S12 methylthiotransferase RimO [Wohlfahrtiimonas chitiniclastica]MBS7814541.1 30S ribosomal protein S12 methylthiotransferase RimO [Wohlfahrtiimonas chitiniclastica]MBS7826267.1 30S ribosomal protein S12 methylthiotransferase RimO [Wohlfahrtiimonas chitiniclastica]MBS7834405.1 30S ribosomal protein S12 methylthiotransferase RimO [Wohlfahrtiimonas chitiniclastica]MBS7836091.1 30S ribosomal protein S12 methylthiotransferase RimO [Wohlfahrtiimonas chitiniclastica]MDC72516